LLADFAAGQLPQLTEIEQLAGHLHSLAENDAPAAANIDGLDPQLLGIFRTEAQGHLASLEVSCRAPMATTRRSAMACSVPCTRSKAVPPWPG
jgi:hypothetical protein